MLKERVKLFFKQCIPVVVLLFWSSFSPAAELKNVIILDFIDTEVNPNCRYLVTSITEAVKKSLMKKFFFTSTERYSWEVFARDNFLFEEDLHTKSVPLNLGLLAKQDIVISGSFRIIPGGKDEENTSTIETHVRIIDVPKKHQLNKLKKTIHIVEDEFLIVLKIKR